MSLLFLRLHVLFFLSTIVSGCLARANDPGGSPDAGNACFGCIDENQCRGLPCSAEGAECQVTPRCTYQGSCVCIGGSFQCTYTDCWGDVCNAADPDPASVTYQLTAVGVASGEGFDLDGLNNAPPPGGSSATVAGCGTIDASGGVDDALPVLATAWAGAVDLDAALGGLVGNATPDAGTPSARGIEVTLDHLASADVANDGCVLVHVTVHTPGSSPITVDGTGRITNHVFEGLLTSPLALDVPLGDRLTPSSCSGGVCQSANLRLTLENARLRLVLGATTTLGPGSVLSGVVFVADPDGSYATRNDAGLAAAITAFAAPSGLLPSVTATLVSAATDAADLHQEPAGTLSGCNGASVTTTNANALSVALALGGATP